MTRRHNLFYPTTLQSVEQVGGNRAGLLNRDDGHFLPAAQTDSEEIIKRSAGRGKPHSTGTYHIAANNLASLTPASIRCTECCNDQTATLGSNPDCSASEAR